MNSKNNEKKIIVTSKKDKSNLKNNNKKNSPFIKGKMNANLGEINFIGGNQFYNELSGDKDKNFFSPTIPKSQYQATYNNMNKYAYNDSSYIFPPPNIDISVLTDSNIFDKTSTNTNSLNNTINKTTTKGLNNNISLHEVKTSKSSKNNIKNINLSKSTNSNSFIGSINNKMNNLTYNSEPFDSKYSIKINKIKDDYIDFLQKEFEDNTKNKSKLDSNNKELLKKCDDLMHDNRILSNTLNDRNSRLNKIIQENLLIKAELDKAVLSNQKNEQKIVFYEEQFSLYKANNENYQKIIQELKDQIEQLNLNLAQMEKEKIENEKAWEEKMKEEVENTKKNLEEIYINKKKDDNEKIGKETKVLVEQIKLLQEKSQEMAKDLANKEKMFDLVCKENEKLTHENSLYRNQIDQNARQISELNTIIKHKDNIINNLKTESINNDKFLNKSGSCSMMKFDGSEYLNENISKLITDNEENKMRIELLNNKIKSIDEIEKKYNELMNGKRTLTLTEKLALHMNTDSKSPNNSKTHFNYNGQNNIKNATYQKTSANYKNYQDLMSPKKLEMHVGEINNILNSPDLFKNKYEKNNFNTNKKDYPLSVSTQVKNKTKDNNIFISSNMTQSRIERIESRQKRLTESIKRSIEHKNTVDREIKVRTKPDKSYTKTTKLEVKNSPVKTRYYNKKEDDDKVVQAKEKKVVHGKELETEKDEVKESLREMNRKKNYTHKPKINSYSLDEQEYEKKNNENSNINDKNNEQKITKPNKEYYLYGIDRNDLFHIFNINDKRWIEAKKIAEIDLDDKSTTFRKDYQYEGTLLYNTLNGVYILTGAKTDTLYYYDSTLNKITKICRFSNSHDNGSIMYDTISNCLYVFGGKKITSCEYYSFNDKKIYKLPDLIYDRANASFIVSNNKIYGFFGFSYSKDTYSKTIEYIDYNRKDKWVELKNIQLLKDDISFDVESVSTMYYKQNQNQILIYCGIQGEDEDFVTEYYLLYDTRNNTMDKIKKWDMQQYKSMGKKWKNYNFKKSDPKGFHFAKNSRFLSLPKTGSYEGYNEREPIDIMIDYKNNIHYILQDKQKIDIYRSDL